MISEKQIHPQRVWVGGIIGPYFFENEAVKSARYRDTITWFFLPKLDDIDVVLTRQNNSITARDISWSCTLSFRSCDLTSLDFFLWGYSKSKVYVNDPTSTHALQKEIKRCINEIQPQL